MGADSPPSSLACFAKVSGAISGDSKFASRVVRRGQEVALTVSCASVPAAEDIFKKLPPGVKAGDVLVGTLTIAKKPATPNVGGAYDMPDGYPVSFTVPPKPQAAAKVVCCLLTNTEI